MCQREVLVKTRGDAELAPMAGVFRQWPPCARGFLSQRGSISSPAGHVFPEFKESDAMFAAERVSSVVGGSSWHCGTDLLSHPLPAKRAGLAFLHFVWIGDHAGRTDQDRESDPSFLLVTSLAAAWQAGRGSRALLK